MVNRREFLGIAAGAGAALALAPELLRAHQQSAGTLIQRAIPSSGEMLPVISFKPRPRRADRSSSRARIAKEILKTLLDNGGKVVDVMPAGYGERGRPHGCQRARDSEQVLLDDARVASVPNVGPVLPGAVRRPTPPP